MGESKILRAIQAMQETAEYEADDPSVGLQGGWTFAVSDEDYSTIITALRHYEAWKEWTAEDNV